ncbi:MAG: hypothetical protein ISS18_03185 [Bacteroidales bacterium]|nr:hypothetical protein [Bacteroidales bacterium]
MIGSLPIITCAQSPLPNFSAGCGEVKATTGERPLLVILLGPDDPFWHPHINVFALKNDGYIYQKTIEMAKPTTNKIILRAKNGQYLGAEKGGGGAVKADRNHAYSHETFTLKDINEGKLMSGDQVTLQAHKGQYIAAQGGGGGEIKADRANAYSHEKFVITKVGGGPIQFGDKISFKTHNGHFLGAVGGGGGSVNATSTNIGSWEKFTLMRSHYWNKNIDLPKTQKFKSAPITINSADGVLQSVFALGNDGYIYQTFTSAFTDDNKWQPWTKLPGNTKFKSAPTALNTPGGNILSVMATGEDGYVYQILFFRGSGSHWQNNWTKLPGNTKFKSAPTSLNTPGGNILSVMATGEDGYVYQILYFRGSGSHWQNNWTKLPGNTKFKSAPTALNTPGGNMLSVMATGEDGYVYQILFFRGPGSHWQNKWTKLHGNLTVKSAPWSMNSADGKLAIVYVLGDDNRIYEKVFFRGSGSYWTDWEPLPGNNSYVSGAAAIHRLARKNTPEYYRKLMFGSDNSIRGYFLENSYGKFTFKEAYITQWLTIKDDPSTPLDESSFDFIHFFDHQTGANERKSNWIIQQVEKLTPFRFSQYDKNSDGKITLDELSIYWIYPGDWDARCRKCSPPLVPVPSLTHGVEIGWLARGGAGQSLETIAEELAHQAFNLGDLYTEPGNPYPGVGPFSLMGSQGVYHLDPWAKIKLGWIKPGVITTDASYSLASVETNPEVYILYNPQKGAKEYFIVENRWPGNSYEENLPDKGLAIWHIDESGCPQHFNARKIIHLVSPVANKLQLWDGADPATGYDFTPISTPTNSNWFDGTSSGISVRNIPTSGKYMNFYIDVP